MRRRDRDSPSDAEKEEEEEEGLEEEEDRPRRRRTARSRRPPPRGRPHPIRGWQATREQADEAKLAALRETAHRPRAHYWRWRDSFWFGPVLALILLVLIIGALVAFTGNWPPAYVIESGSMQHGPNDQLGLINTGDMVLAQKIPSGSITTYISGLGSGQSTYGESGDVILYHPNGAGGTPVIHRAILYLAWNPLNGTYNATQLNGLPCGSAPGAVYSVSSTLSGCGTIGLSGELTLYHIGWQSVSVPVRLDPAVLGNHSGFVTMGDGNFMPLGCTGSACSGAPDQQPGGEISQLVEPAWVVGVARGMLPWFGAFKLLLDGNAGEVPAQSWQFLGITVVVLIGAAFGLHYAWSSVRPLSPRRAAEAERRREAEKYGEDEEDEDPRGRRRMFRLRVRDEEEPPEVKAPPRPRLPRLAFERRRRGGRPKPRVRHSGTSRLRHRPPDDDEDDL